MTTQHASVLGEYLGRHKLGKNGNNQEASSSTSTSEKLGDVASSRKGSKQPPSHQEANSKQDISQQPIDASSHKLPLSKVSSNQKGKPVIRTTKTQQLRIQQAQLAAGDCAGINILPEEVLLCVFECLNVADLLVCARVSRSWNTVADDNHLWFRHYTRHVSTPKVDQTLGSEPQKNTAAYWKKKCIQSCCESNRRKAAGLLKKMDAYTGLCANTEKALTRLGTVWRMTLRSRDNREFVIDHRDVFYFRMSVCVRWYRLDMPPIRHIQKIYIHSANPVFFENGTPATHSICHKESHYELTFDWHRLCQDSPVLVSNDSVDVRILPPLIIATWKEGGELAFITGSFHAHNLVTRCLGSISRFPIIASSKKKGYQSALLGLYGCSCTVELRNQRNSLWSQQFRSIYFEKDEKAAGSAVLNLISPDESSQHSPIPRQLTLPWKTDLFKGILNDLCILDVTLINDNNKPAWTVSCPVMMKTPAHTMTVTYDYDGGYSMLDYADSTGSLHMDIVWEEELHQNMVTCLQLAVSLCAIGQ